MFVEWLPPQARALNLWTELVEYCDWDEEAAMLLVEQVRSGLPPKPPAHIVEIVKLLAVVMDKQPKEQEVGEA